MARDRTEATGIEIVGLDHVVLRVGDMARSIRFYERVLGCREERRVPAIGLVQMRAGTALIDLVPADAAEGPARVPANMDHFALRLAHLDEPALRAHLAAHGIEAGDLARRYGADGFGPSIYITDPDGNTVELKGPPETADLAT